MSLSDDLRIGIDSRYHPYASGICSLNPDSEARLAWLVWLKSDRPLLRL